MPERIERLIIDFRLELREGVLISLQVIYLPVSTVQTLQELRGDITILVQDLERHLREQLGSIVEFMTARVARREFELPGKVGFLSTTLRSLHYFGKENKLAGVPESEGPFEIGVVPRNDLTDGQQRLLDSVLATAEKLAWDHLAARLNVRPGTPSYTEVFISYRSTKQDFAEALAVRLGREGVIPFFDKWDVKAGDSVPGKIEEAFGRSTACIIVLSDDFALGQWATAEMETAVTKRIQEEYKVIPVLYDHCDIPELLKPLRHVDFSSHDPQTFESKFGELIDAIYGLELNPFRT